MLTMNMKLVLAIQQVMSTLLMQVQPKLIHIHAVLTGLVHSPMLKQLRPRMKM